MSITITVKTDQTKAYLSGKRQTLVEQIIDRINFVDRMMASRVRQNLSGAVLNRQSGKLFSTVSVDAAALSGDKITAAVTAGGDDAPYGIYFEKGGLGPYEIRPTNGTVLAFMSQGKQIFAKVIHHPAIPHLPWFEPEMEEAKDQMTQELNDVFAEVLKP